MKLRLCWFRLLKCNLNRRFIHVTEILKDINSLLHVAEIFPSIRVRNPIKNDEGTVTDLGCIFLQKTISIAYLYLNKICN
jgi:hypothetical protein